MEINTLSQGIATTAASRRTVPDLVDLSARSYGQRPALRGWTEGAYRSVSFQDLATAAKFFSRGLTKLGLRPGDRVALVAENGPNWAIAWLGVAIAGGICVPISASANAREVTGVLHHSGSRFAVAAATQVSKIADEPLDRIVVISSPPHRSNGQNGVLDALGARGISFSEVASTNEGMAESAIGARLHPDDVVAIVYTSGTTGAPKGVMLTHANLLADAAAAAKAINAGPSDRLLLILPLHHSFPLAGGFMTSLHAGVEIVFESDLRHLRERMAEIRPTILMGVPALYESMYRTIVARLEAEGRLARFRAAERLSATIKRWTGLNLGEIIFRELHQSLGGQIRLLATGGAATSPDLIRRYLNLGLPLLQGWGQAEATSIVTAQSPSWARFHLTNDFERLAGSVGRVVDGVEIRLADVPEKQIYPAISGEGEVLVRGPIVMKGYWANEEATRATIQNGWLRTGDLGRLDAQGNLTMTGRVKSLIVLPSGEKATPEDVEEAFQDSSLARDICVLGRPSAQQRMQVCAVIYPDPSVLRERSRKTSEPLTAETISRWVEDEVTRVQADVAPFKRISQVILSDSPLPRTELRKVRRGLVDADRPFDAERLLSTGLALGQSQVGPNNRGEGAIDTPRGALAGRSR